MLDRVVQNPLIAKLQAGVTFTSRRHEVIANNIANIQTPGYKAMDLSEKAFTRALADANGRLDEALKPVASPDAGSPREDGNNVSIESEMSKLSMNAMRYNILLSLLDKQFRSLESALRERV